MVLRADQRRFLWPDLFRRILAVADGAGLERVRSDGDSLWSALSITVFPSEAREFPATFTAAWMIVATVERPRGELVFYQCRSWPSDSFLETRLHTEAEAAVAFPLWIQEHVI